MFFLVGLLAFVLSVYFVYRYIIVNIQKSRRRTLEEVYNNRELLEKYSIVAIKTPEDYGLSYEEVTFKSLDNLDLKGWYIKGGEKGIVVSHGRSGNRLNVLEYVGLLKEKGYFDIYSVLIYDLRNGGESTEAPTGVGEYFGKDIAGAIRYMKNIGHEKFLLWGFSMGALGTLKSIEDYKRDIEYSLEGLILDSPLSNAKEVLAYSFVKEGHNRFISKLSVVAYNFHMRGRLKDYRIGRLINKIDIDTLIFQSKDDIITPFDIFEREKESILNRKVRVEVWNSAKHLYLRRVEKERYDKIIVEFIEKINGN